MGENTEFIGCLHQKLAGRNAQELIKALPMLWQTNGENWIENGIISSCPI
jgi:hypothetical protein